VRNWPERLVYPGVMLIVVGSALVAIGRGAGTLTVATCGSLFGAVLIVALERVLTYLPEWNRSQGDVSVDILHTLLSTSAVPAVFRALAFGALATIASQLSGALGFALWPHSAPLVVQLALALLIAEFGQYWMHRLGHTARPLWRLHAMHHSVGRLHWLNAGRFHPLDTLVQYAAEVTPLVLLGASDSLLALFTVFTATNGGLRHSNIRQHLAGWNWIFSTADLHRWHHSTVVAEANANYGANLIFWDVVFGTRKRPSDRPHPAALGLDGMPDFPRTWLRQLASPFQLERYEPRAEEQR
jgi:ornithine lipid hydroxylase